MKHTAKIIILTGVLSIFMSSCKIATKSASIGVETVRKSGFVMAKPLISEIEVDNQKIEGRAIINNRLYANSIGGPEAAAMNLAVIDAVKKASCDIIVQPIYEIENSGTNTTATVRGFAARYKAFREITPADTAAFSMRAELDRTSAVRYRDNTMSVAATAGAPKKRSKVGAIIGLVGLIVLLGAIPAAIN